ncbi:MAG: ATP-binding cassette domain-containing protein, partial [Candidatus Diapherotrites archaeon]|nr:ATP-binding cassette domain-containing protein [Candidatus Diapherotrites archaeon]
MARIAVVNKELCSPLRCQLECVKICPVNRMGEECIVINEEINKARISEVLCTGTGLCVKACPFDAVKVVNTPEALKEAPLFQYGENEFRLFRMPFPKKGVVGIIGSNGVGKSTVLKIIAGELKPNLGNYEDDIEWREVIESFRGQEVQSFFERLSEKKLRVSYKPQDIEFLPKIIKGKVGDLLKKVDERGVVDEFAEFFNVHNLFDSKLSELSGGELQRVAILAAVAKDAELY